MATEQRLIDAKAFDLRVSQKKMTEVFPNWKELPVEVQDAVCKHAQHLHMLLETQTTIDAVEVVRCRHCEHLRSGINSFCVFYWCGNSGGLTNIYDPDTDYCPRGERMTDHGK